MPAQIKILVLALYPHRRNYAKCVVSVIILTDELSVAFADVHVHGATAVTLKFQFTKGVSEISKLSVLQQL
jgi:hypothetical protein